MDAYQDNVGYIWGNTSLMNGSWVDAQLSLSSLDVVPHEVGVAHWSECLSSGLKFAHIPMFSQASFLHMN